MMINPKEVRAIEEMIRGLFSDVKLEREQMHVYQSETAYRHLMDNPFSALFIDMGLGKTVSTATVLVDLLSNFELGDDEKVLIVGPMRVATSTWPDEFRQWRHLAPFVPELIHVSDKDPRVRQAERDGRQAARDRREFNKEVEAEGRMWAAGAKERIRKELATSRRQIHIVSFEWLQWLCEFYGPKWPYRWVVIDESSGFKDHRTARYQALQSICEIPGAITRMHQLTATPAAESYIHLFAQIYLLDRGKRLGRNITAYRQRYFRQNRWSQKWELLPGAEAKILSKISDICLVMKEKDYLPREEPRFIERVVHMDEAQTALYRSMEKDMLVTLDDGSEITADTAAALSAKLLQMASGVLYETKLEDGEDPDDPDAKVIIKKIHPIHDHKMEALKQIVEEAQGKPILVSYSHRSTLARLKREFPKAVKMDREAKCKKPWNDGKIQMLLMHPKSGGHGLNLQQGGHIIVYFDIPWSLELYWQLIGRLSRQGQKTRVVVYLLICEGTLDRVVIGALQAKADAQNKLFSILKKMKARLRRILQRRKMEQLSTQEKEAIEEMLVDYVEQEIDEETGEFIPKPAGRHWFFHAESDSYAKMTWAEVELACEDLTPVEESEVPQEFIDRESEEEL